MELTKFRWHRLAAALGIGLGIELLEGICVSFLPPLWADWIGELPLQPASYLVTLLAKPDIRVLRVRSATFCLPWCFSG